MVSLNTSGRPQLRAALKHYAKADESGQKSHVAAMLFQEHKQHGIAWVDEIYNAKKDGWSLRGAEAVPPMARG